MHTAAAGRVEADENPVPSAERVEEAIVVQWGGGGKYCTGRGAEHIVLGEEEVSVLHWGRRR